MKYYDIKAISPISGRLEFFSSIPENHLRLNESDELCFAYNHIYLDCPVISAKLVPQHKIDAMLSYFKQFGTGCE